MTSAAVFIDLATLADLPALVALDSRCSSHPWIEADFRAEIDVANHARTLVVRALDPSRAPQVVAFCAYRWIVDEVHIHNLATGPEHRRLGLARRLVRTVFQASARAGMRWAMLEVRIGNEAARRLYEAEGFTVVAQRRAYYANPVEDAMVLRRPISTGETQG